MKNKLIIASIMAGMLAASVPALAANSAIVLQHGGIGQKAADPNNFGVAVCDKGTQSASGVPLQVTANGITVNATAFGPIQAGGCTYTYLSYASFGMAKGKIYSVQVAIDPNQTITTNIDAPATYTIKVPGGKVLGASTMSDAERQSLLNQLASMEAMLQSLLAKLGM